MILGAAIGLSGAVQADVTIDNNFENKAMKTTTVVNYSQAEFGAYKVERSLQLVPSAIAAADQVVASKGTMSVVQAAASDDVVGKGSVVRNTLTNEVTTLTGNVIVLLSKNANASDLAAQANMEVVSLFPGTDIAVFAVQQGKDLVEAYNSLSGSELALSSKVEVTDTIFTAQ